MKVNFDAPPKSPEVNNGIYVQYPSGKRNVPQWRWLVVLALMMLLPAYFLWSIAGAVLDRDVRGIVIQESVVLRAPASGMIQKSVAEGSTVNQGQVVALLKQIFRSKEDTESVSGSAISADAAYAIEERNFLSAAVQNDKERVVLAQNRLNQMQLLFREGAATRQEVDAARMQLLDLQSSLQMRVRDLALQNSVAARQLSSGRSVESTSEVIAPIASIIRQVYVVDGQWVAEGEELLVMEGKRASMIEAYLPPEDLKYVKEGQKARITFKSGERFDAVVQQIAREAQRRPSTGAQESQKYVSGSALAVKLRPTQDLPLHLRVNNLPVDVRFLSNRWF